MFHNFFFQIHKMVGKGQGRVGSMSSHFNKKIANFHVTRRQRILYDHINYYFYKYKN